jgi:ribosomal protein L3 glutamine methyltransferase
LSSAERDERIETFLTPRDWLRYAVGRFLAAGLAFGHGAVTALDEAAFLILEGLKLPVDMLDPFLDARLLRHERARLCDLIEARASTRKPAAYLLNRTYIKGVPFYIDERAIVPRSLIGELVMTAFAEDNALTGDPRRIASALDLCTGGGSLAILSARVFANARVDAVELSPEALEVAKRNLEEHGLEERITLKEGDLFAPVGNARYDLILANPPYVDAATIADFPPEYAWEPRIAHAGGADGLDIVRRILGEAPAHLAAGGALVCEVGGGRALLERDFPHLPFLWLDTEDTSGEVLLLRARDFGGAKRRLKRQGREGPGRGGRLAKPKEGNQSPGRKEKKARTEGKPNRPEGKQNPKRKLNPSADRYISMAWATTRTRVSDPHDLNGPASMIF